MSEKLVEILENVSDCSSLTWDTFL